MEISTDYVMWNFVVQSFPDHPDHPDQEGQLLSVKVKFSLKILNI